MIYFVGDAAYSTHHKEIARRLGAMDLSFIPIGAYESRWFMKSVHTNPAEAVQAHLESKVERKYWDSLWNISTNGRRNR
jgi:L-ascorbate metabolism protein UlaG (beta-lactamase superfamily)